jgi:hypothetical protein
MIWNLGSLILRFQSSKFPHPSPPRDFFPVNIAGMVMAYGRSWFGRVKSAAICMGNSGLRKRKQSQQGQEEDLEKMSDPEEGPRLVLGSDNIVGRYELIFPESSAGTLFFIGLKKVNQFGVTHTRKILYDSRACVAIPALLSKGHTVPVFRTRVFQTNQG